MAGTFPSGPDYGYAVAQPQAGAPTGQAPQAPQISNASAEALGAEARADQITAADLKTLAGATDQYELHMDAISAQDAINKIRAAKNDLTYGDGGFMTLKGDQVTKPGPDGASLLSGYQTRLQTQIDVATKGLSAQALQMLSPKLAEEQDSFKTDFAKHSVTQVEKYDQSVFKDTLEQAKTDAVRYSGDVLKLQEVATRAAAATKLFYTRNGLKPDAAMKDAESGVIRAGIETRLTMGDGPGALALYNMTKGKLVGADALVMQRDLKTTAEGELSRSWVANGGRVPEGVPTPTGNAPNGLSADAQAAHDRLKARFAAEGLPFTVTSTFRTPGENAAAHGAGNSTHLHGDAVDLDFKGMTPEQRARATQIIQSDDAVNGFGYYPQSGSAHFDVGHRTGKTAWGSDYTGGTVGSGWDPAITAQTRGWVTGQQKEVQASNADPTLKDDVLATSVNKATGSVAGPAPGPNDAQGPPGFLDTRRLTIANEQWKLEMYLKAQQQFSANPTMLANVKQQIDMQYGTKAQGITIAQQKLTAAVEDYVTKGGPPDAAGNPTPATQRPPPEIWNQLTFEKQRSIDATLAHNAKGQDPPFTDDAKKIFLRLSDVATSDPDTFRQMDLSTMIPIMPKAELLKLQEMRDQIQKSGQAPVDSTKMFSMADHALNLLGVDIRPNAGKDSVNLRAEMQTQLMDWSKDFQNTNKRKPNDVEIRDQIDSMLIQGRTERQGWWARNIGTLGADQQAQGSPIAKGESGEGRGTAPHLQFRYTVPPSQRGEFYVPYDKIREAERTKIETRLMANGDLRDAMPAAERQRVVEDKYQQILQLQGRKR